MSEALSDAAVKDHPKVQVLRARTQASLGKTAEAISTLKELLTKHPDSLPGHYFLGQVSEQIGDLDAARAAYGWFDAAPQQFIQRWQGKRDKAFDSAEDVVLIGRAGCSHCSRARTLLEQKGWAYDEIEANPRRLRATSGKATTPQIFVDGQYVGGAEELEKYLAKQS